MNHLRVSFLNFSYFHYQRGDRCNNFPPLNNQDGETTGQPPVQPTAAPSAGPTAPPTPDTAECRDDRRHSDCQRDAKNGHCKVTTIDEGSRYSNCLFFVVVCFFSIWSEIPLSSAVHTYL